MHRYQTNSRIYLIEENKSYSNEKFLELTHEELFDQIYLANESIGQNPKFE